MILKFENIRFKRIAITITCVAILRILSILFQLNVDLFFEHNRWISILYIPAGINIFAVLIANYQGMAGIALGTFIWNLLAHHLSLDENIAIACVSGLTGGCAVYVFNWLSRQPSTNSTWSKMSLSRMIFLFALYGVINTAAHNLTFVSVLRDYELSLTNVTHMFIGDFTGALLLFIFLNLATSLWMATQQPSKRNV